MGDAGQERDTGRTMSQENVEVIRGMYDAFNRADPASVRFLHSEAELHQNPDMPGAGSYFGREEFVKGIASFMSGLDDVRFEPEEIEEAGNLVVVRMRAWGRGRVSGISGDRLEFHAWTVRDGKAFQCFVRASRAEALEAVGLSE